MKVRVHEKENYKGIYFNGQTFRIAIDPSQPISELEYPEFYDVKITDTCYGRCPYCYMDSNSDSEQYSDVVRKIDSFFGGMSDNEKPFQVAIGGGEPTECSEFIPVLKAFYRLGITPNYTTNGMFIDKDPNIVDNIINATRDYCGGVAVSCHQHLRDYWCRAADLFWQKDIMLNFHLVISDKDSCDQFKIIYNTWKEKVDYFVLLPYISQGRAVKKEIDWEYLVSIMPEDTRKIAFGANFYPYLIKNSNLFNVSLYEPESMSKFLSLEGSGAIYPSSFHLEPIKDKLF